MLLTVLGTLRAVGWVVRVNCNEREFFFGSTTSKASHRYKVSYSGLTQPICPD